MLPQLEELVWHRARFACEYCFIPQAFDRLRFEVDHVIAVTHGGKTIVGNLALTCLPCNRFKGPNLSGIDPQSGRLIKLFHPRRHSWRHHFQWLGGQLAGRTAIGRTTIRVLHINDPVRSLLRAQLFAEGVLKLPE